MASAALSMSDCLKDCTCTPAGHPNSLAMGNIATLMQILSMLHSNRAKAVGPTTLKNCDAVVHKRVSMN